MAQYLQQGYDAVPTLSLEEVAEAISHSSNIELALIEIAGFDSSIWGLCQQLRDQNIPFLVISPRHHAAIQQASMVDGALGLLGKPLAMREFSRLV